jgi:hypothetical protein
MKGNETREPADTECPICFLHYSAINRTRCCQAHICTECYLQVRPQRDKTATCPFCNAPRVQVSVAQELDERAILERDQEEQKVIEAEIRSRTQQQQCLGGSGAGGDDEVATGTSSPSFAAASTPSSTGSGSKDSSPDKSFGSSLEEHTRLMRARSGSVASEGSSNNAHSGGGGSGSLLGDFNLEDIAALAVAPEERKRLEEEVRAQHSHPLARRLQAEEAERRLQNDLNFYQVQSQRLHELRSRRELLSRTLAGAGFDAGSGRGGGTSGSAAGAASSEEVASASESAPRPGRDWNRIVEAFESGGANRQVQSLDDLVVLEAAILLSMEEEARRREQLGGTGGGDNTSNTGNSNSSSIPPFDAAHHASQGFPLARGRALAGAAAAAALRADGGAHLQSLMRSLQSSSPSSSSVAASASRRGQRRSRMFGNDASMSTAAMLLRGITEEEQIAMAIAASLAESSGPPSSTPGGGGEESSSIDNVDNDDDEEVITFESDPDAQQQQEQEQQRGRQSPSSAVHVDVLQESAPPSASRPPGSADQRINSSGEDRVDEADSRGASGEVEITGTAPDKVRELEDDAAAAVVVDSLES